MFETCEKQAYCVILTVIIYPSSKQRKHWMCVKLMWWKNQLSKATERDGWSRIQHTYIASS